ncbi:DUF4240 domain-containing protein [Nonomuraea sp. NPDC050790]|uniref:DUF4240 domain-containing protein n=1 Tax=Nonomuraea sp. NPDC050790 TaxID=3364371 RepID=UPI0037886E46
MDEETFWNLIERSGQRGGSERDRVEWLTEELSRLPAEAIADYCVWWKVTQNRAGTWDLAGAYDLVLGGGSSNSFEYFANWLIGLGREACERVTGCPEELVELPQVRRALAQRHARRLGDPEAASWPEDDWPAFEALGHPGMGAYEQVTGRVPEVGVEARFPIGPVGLGGEEWDAEDPAEAVRRLPRTARRLGIG